MGYVSVDSPMEPAKRRKLDVDLKEGGTGFAVPLSETKGRPSETNSEAAEVPEAADPSASASSKEEPNEEKPELKRGRSLSLDRQRSDQPSKDQPSESQEQQSRQQEQNSADQQQPNSEHLSQANDPDNGIEKKQQQQQQQQQLQQQQQPPMGSSGAHPMQQHPMMSGPPNGMNPMHGMYNSPHNMMMMGGGGPYGHPGPNAAAGAGFGGYNSFMAGPSYFANAAGSPGGGGYPMPPMHQYWGGPPHGYGQFSPMGGGGPPPMQQFGMGGGGGGYHGYGSGHHPQDYHLPPPSNGGGPPPGSGGDPYLHQQPHPSSSAVAASATGGNQSPHQQQSQQSLDTNAKATNMGLLTNRNPVLLYMSCDDDSLSGYQCLVRRQIELFEARSEDVESNAQGRNKPIVLGQVGIRCRHCTSLPPRHRARASVYYPAKLMGLYQAAQNMATIHLCQHCQRIPSTVRNELLTLRERKSSAGGGKKYWGDGARVLGVYEAEDGLRFDRR